MSGNTILRDGKPWIPHGFYQIAFEVPAKNLVNEQVFWSTAQDDYTPAEYTAMAQFGADSVRIQVAQTGIDPNGMYYSADYVAKATDAIACARSAGLTVIVSVQDEPQTGETMPLGVPGPATQRVWGVLAPMFGKDTGVLFELFNEPYIKTSTFSETTPPTTADWLLWQGAMNSTIATIRSNSAVNVLVADGLDYAEQLSGAPSLTDPLNEYVYAAHPYSHNSDDQKSSSWDFKFGNFAMTNPVIITEWGDGYYCNNSTGTASMDFMIYLQSHGIGLEAGAWDWAPLGFGTVMEGFPNNQITSFPAAGTPLCNTSTGDLKTLLGAGKLLQTWYQTGTPSSTLE